MIPVSSLSEVPSTSIYCKRCEAKLVSHLFCFECSRLQPVSASNDYFSALGIPSVYELDQTLLEERFQQIVGELHPDFYLNSSKEDQKLSERSSTILNQAFDVLKDPFKRADYLMRNMGKDFEWNERILPNGFLEEMFSLQEELDGMLEKHDQPGLKRFQYLLDKRRWDIESGLIPLFRMIENMKELELVLEQLQMKLNAERYLQRLLDRIQLEETT